MAKGNPLMGQLRGKVGDVVFSRLNGEQVSRAYNGSPANPRSDAQMYQRMILASVVSFYKHATQNFFKFAFEDKRANESDYNAFVRRNMKAAPANTDYQIKKGAPAIGNYVMTSGSLPSPILLDWEDEETSMKPGIALRVPVAAVGSAVTDGDISRALMASYGYKAGDFVTFVEISSNAIANTDLEIAKEERGLLQDMARYNNNWSIKQFVIDPDSTGNGTMGGILEPVSNEASELVFNTTHTYADTNAYGFNVNVSRKEGSKVLVSNSMLMLNSQTSQCVEMIGRSNEWKLFVAEDFSRKEGVNVRPDNIQEGSIAFEEEGLKSPVLTIQAWVKNGDESMRLAVPGETWQVPQNKRISMEYRCQGGTQDINAFNEFLRFAKTKNNEAFTFDGLPYAWDDNSFHEINFGTMVDITYSDVFGSLDSGKLVFAYTNTADAPAPITNELTAATYGVYMVAGGYVVVELS